MWTEARLQTLLTTPSAALVEDMKRIPGDIMVLGAGGKMGPSLCVLAKQAILAAGLSKEVIAVSRFTDPDSAALLRDCGIRVIPCNLLDREQVASLPRAENILYMAGRKFGTQGNQWQTWAMNATASAFVADTFRGANMVVFSSGNIYPLTPLAGGGCSESDPVGPRGEYAMSCLARERAFEYAAHTHGTRVLLYRLNYAVDLRYGVLFDIASRVMKAEPISLDTPSFNCIWQGSANEIAIRSLLHAQSPARVLNVTGPETLSVRKVAEQFGTLFSKEPVFTGTEKGDAYLSDAGAAHALFGYPTVSAQTLIRWQAEWMLAGGRTLDKPTHYEERGGVY